MTDSEIPVIDMTEQQAAPVREAPVEKESVVVPEVKTEEAPKPEEKELVSPKIAKVRAREAEAKRLVSEAKETMEKVGATESFFEELKKTPTQALKKAGLTFQQFAELVLAEPDSLTPEKPEDLTKKEIDELKRRLDEKEAKEAQDKEAAEQARIDRAITDFQGRIENTINSDPDRFELIIANEAQDLVFEVVREHWNEREEILDPEKAADLVEKFLEAKLDKAIQSKKAKARLQPEQKSTSFGRTLTQAATSPIGSGVKVDVAGMTEEERIKHASKLLRFNN